MCRVTGWGATATDVTDSREVKNKKWSGERRTGLTGTKPRGIINNNMEGPQ